MGLVYFRIPGLGYLEGKSRTLMPHSYAKAAPSVDEEVCAGPCHVRI